MLIYVLAAVALLLFVIGVATDLRRFSNAVFLGLSLALPGVGLVAEFVEASPEPYFTPVALSFLALLTLAVLLLLCYLLANGVQMLRREGMRPGNVLPLLAGLCVLAVVGLLLLVITGQSEILAVVFGLTALVTVYFVFLFTCFVVYGSLYGRLRVRGDLDYVVVLGSGLVEGNRVPPLLAGRLDRARAVYEAQAARGNAPVLITSGGQGPDEDLPEAHAMAAYLTDRGLPAEHVLREDASRTTEENLRNSRAIMEGARADYRCAVVTSNFHVFRAAILARATGVRGQVLGSPTARYFWLSATLREFAAVILSDKAVNAAACLLLAQQFLVAL
ncbi:hypothetical protein CUT44_26020 [Streptomyces carminius]|uniref:DUF218 domain-containing protein n=1 Tax=Streptomyces carminius TaxID=2665496 RepID=A0A2M8LT22_9ACTN|nr:YdcF family protein [Streptomyces carminius]PJE95104.1 hypothetical protein CUT44_26020 [Streptomyces carminius]